MNATQWIAIAIGAVFVTVAFLPGVRVTHGLFGRGVGRPIKRWERALVLAIGVGSVWLALTGRVL